MSITTSHRVRRFAGTTSRNGYREQQLRPDPAEQPVLMMQDFGAPAE